MNKKILKKRTAAFLMTLAVTVTGVPGLCAVDSVAAKEKEGSVLNIYTWNEEFKEVLADCYPGYEEVGGDSAKIGDVTVKWNIIPSDSSNYQIAVDMALAGQSGAAADEKIDMFLVEPDYALKYLDSDSTLPVKSLGIKKKALKNQFKYTQDLGSDSKGVLKALSWQSYPGVMIYNRNIAKEVLGTDKPDKVQKLVSDWDKYNDVASKMVEAGYKMTSSPDDTYRVYAQNAKSAWVQDGVVSIDKNIEKWVKSSKKLVDEGAVGKDSMWFDSWFEGFSGGVFCYFGPSWLIDYIMADYTVARDGDWAVTEGPQNFYWGGTWICAAKGTDNPTLVSKIMKTLTCDTAVMKKIAKKRGDFVNNKKAMSQISADGYKSDILGGQNPIPVFINCAKSIKVYDNSEYDGDLDIYFPTYMQDYFSDYMSYDDALDSFYQFVTDLYPEIKKSK